MTAKDRKLRRKRDADVIVREEIPESEFISVVSEVCHNTGEVEIRDTC